MNVIFFGTPQIAADVLTFLLNHGVQIVAAISKPDRPIGRSRKLKPTPVKQVAEAHSIPVYQPEIVSAQEFSETLLAYHADLFVVVAYGEIIKQHLLDMPKLGCINLHASLLPKYRGAAPIHWSIINGEKETGVTVMHMVKKMDAGDIIKQVSVPIGPRDTCGNVTSRILAVGSQALLDVIHDFDAGTVHSIPQDHKKATYAPKIELEDCELDWSRPAQDLHNLVRGANPQPGAWCTLTLRGQKQRLKVIMSSVVKQIGQPGQLLSYDKNNGFMIACGENALRLERVKLEGKREMSDQEFMCGFAKESFAIPQRESRT